MSESLMSVHSRRVISRTIPAAPRLRVGALTRTSEVCKTVAVESGSCFISRDNAILLAFESLRSPHVWPCLNRHPTARLARHHHRAVAFNARFEHDESGQAAK